MLNYVKIKKSGTHTEGVGRRTIKFKHPWTNGQVEAINKKIKQKVMTKYIFSDIIDLEDKLREFINDYNMTAKLKTSGYLSPKDYLIYEK